ncbi:hypothetical protein PR048_017943 [Dryococelus australis]|uniref:Uncharacterized protein n=1 Tax=Dryococelus australis TaxID=614101 RepID=A0ABQ9HAV9_9NEOP|nr:hypothetical protein PR048_017943 [Dryococelus australis]
MWVIEVNMDGAGMKGQGKLEIPEKTHRPGIIRHDSHLRKSVWSSARIKGRGKREIPEKTGRSAASSGTVLTCENPETVRLPPRRTRFNPRPIHTGFSQEVIVPIDAVDRRVFSGTSHFPRPFIPGLLHTHLASLSSALMTSKSRVEGSRVVCLGSTVKDLGSRILGFMFWLNGQDSWVLGQGSRFLGLRSRVLVLGFWVKGLVTGMDSRSRVKVKVTWIQHSGRCVRGNSKTGQLYEELAVTCFRIIVKRHERCATARAVHVPADRNTANAN